MRWHSTYCLRHGADCGYVDSPASAENEPEPSSCRASPKAAYDASDYLRLVDTLPRDPFAGTNLDVPHQSRSLFQLCTLLHDMASLPPRRVADKAARTVMSTKVYYNTPVQRDPDSFVSVPVLSQRRHEPAC